LLRSLFPDVARKAAASEALVNVLTKRFAELAP
jgi:hypothetical protein